MLPCQWHRNDGGALQPAAASAVEFNPRGSRGLRAPQGLRQGCSPTRCCLVANEGAKGE
jgi:hypothetical protein